jgi:hypothetical protein
VVLLDTRPDNFIKTNEGIAPIDLLVTHIEPNSLMES